MTKALTIGSSAEIGLALRQGQRRSSAYVTVYIAETPKQRDQCGRVAFIAAKRLGGAVWRNRSRRKLREGLRIFGTVPPGLDLLLVATSRTADGSPAEIAQAIADNLRKLGVGQVQ